MIVSELSDLASRLSLGPIHRFGRLAVVPLIDRTAKPSGWLTLDAALECLRGTLGQVGQGRVPVQGDPVWRALVATGAERIRRPFPCRAESPGEGL